jgi:hypothetical protein
MHKTAQYNETIERQTPQYKSEATERYRNPTPPPPPQDDPEPQYITYIHALPRNRLPNTTHTLTPVHTYLYNEAARIAGEQMSAEETMFHIDTFLFNMKSPYTETKQDIQREIEKHLEYKIPYKIHIPRDGPQRLESSTCISTIFYNDTNSLIINPDTIEDLQLTRLRCPVEGLQHCEDFQQNGLFVVRDLQNHVIGFPASNNLNDRLHMCLSILKLDTESNKYRFISNNVFIPLDKQYTSEMKRQLSTLNETFKITPELTKGIISEAIVTSIQILIGDNIRTHFKSTHLFSDYGYNTTIIGVEAQRKRMNPDRYIVKCITNSPALIDGACSHQIRCFGS